MLTYPSPKPGELWKISRIWSTGHKHGRKMSLVLVLRQVNGQFSSGASYTSYDVLTYAGLDTALPAHFVERVWP